MGWGGDGKGYGWGGYGGGWGWGGPWGGMMMPYMKGKGKNSGLRSFPDEKKVWIGGIPGADRDIERNKRLVEHMKQAGECVFAHIGKSGAAGAAFKNPEDVQKAIAMLNGSNFEGATIQVDVWTKKEKESS
eukprot:TRINITY_DN64087_c0_g1_i1.p2 TRINITY_DN64087_c0_g1~~TRINITY_DN64087_c0_g1_i1.p2  ORF type:complete len:131 (+),score=39.57 TRINITY_DN64087_c0_g1_i1:66-458(+)